jgi:hypothetical protein
MLANAHRLTPVCILNAPVVASLLGYRVGAVRKLNDFAGGAFSKERAAKDTAAISA